MRADQGEKEAAVQAYLLLRQAVEHLVSARVTLVLVGGLPGSGKSTLSRSFAETCGYKVLSSDVVRKELAGISPTTSAPSRYRRGFYSQQFTSNTYAELVNRARVLLESGVSVVLDASWIDSRQRQRAVELALATSSDLVEFHVSVSPDEARRRMKQRARAGELTSDATPDIAASMAKDEHPWDSAIEVDALDSIDRVLEHMLGAVSIPGSRHTSTPPLTAHSA